MVKGGDYTSLYVGVEVYQEVPTAYQVQVCEGGVGEYIVLRECAHLPYPSAHMVAGLLLREEFPQAVLGQVFFYGLWVVAGCGYGDRFRARVRPDYPDVRFS